MNVDDELRRLFSDEKLDVPVLPGAVDAVVAGAGRVRRRRIAVTATAGALGVATLVGAGLVINGMGTPQGLQPAAPPPVVVTVTVTAPVTPGGGVSVAPPSGGMRTGSVSNPSHPIGPKSAQGLRLGMSKAEAEATGLITPNAEPVSSTGCLGYDYVGLPKDDRRYAVVISERYGLVRMAGRAGATTPEGVTVGTSEAKMKETYPVSAGQHGAVGEWVTAVPGNSDAQYWILVRNSVVSEIRLEKKVQDCYA